MPIDLIRTVQNGLSSKLSNIAYSNPLYNFLLNMSLDWSLGQSVSDSLVKIPTDCWKGNIEKGRWLVSGAFSIEEEGFEDEPLPVVNSEKQSHSLFGETHTIWNPIGVDEDWLAKLHGFSWLRDLRELGGDQARAQARSMIENWISHHKRWSPDVWRSDVIGQRLTHWIGLYNFYGASASEEFQDHVVRSMIIQAKHLSRALGSDTYGLKTLQAIRGLIYAGIALSDRELWLEMALDCLEKETKKQILGDGGHISRSPAQMIEVIKIYIDIRAALALGGYAVPAEIEKTISNLAQVIRFFRYSDRHLAVFHGSQEGQTHEMDDIIKRVGAKGKILRALPQTGYERMTLGRSILMVDTGMAPSYPYDQDAHAAPFAFEFSYGKERIFVNCGTHPNEPDWNDVLRGTAAHNHLSLDYRNICEIKPDGHFARQPKKVCVDRDDQTDALLLEGSHDGYMQINGITHRRRFYLGNHGHDLRGEENLHCSTGLSQPIDVSVRFHLHPRVLVSLIQDGKEALLRLPNGSGWRFFHSGAHLELENSIYLGQGSRPRKTKQIVLYGQMDQDQASLKWALTRETK